MEETELKVFQATGKSVDEAIIKGLNEMGLSFDEVSIEIVQHETKGILGIGAKPAIVKLTQRPEEEFDIPDYMQKTGDRREDRRDKRDRREKPDRREKNRREDRTERTERPEKPEKAEKPERPEPRPERPAKDERRPAKERREEVKPSEAEKPAEAPEAKPAETEKPARREQERRERPERREKRERPARHEQDKPAACDEEPSEEEVTAAPAEPEKVINYTLEAAEGNPAAEFVKGLIEHMGATGKVLAAQDEDCLRLRIDSEMMGMLIGHRGETLDAMQYLTGLVINRNRKTEGYKRITLNTEEYREKREETLKRLAKKVASQVRATGRPRALEPMNPYERRVLHSTLQNNPDVTTHSEGEEPNRRVVVTPRRVKSRGSYQKTRGSRRNTPRSGERRASAPESSEADVISREEYERIYEAAKKGALSKEMFEELSSGAKQGAAEE